MTGNDGAHKFGHVVSVMFENRSFDNLLGTCTSRERSLRSRAWQAAICRTRSRATRRTPSVEWCGCTWRPRWTRPTLTRGRSTRARTRSCSGRSYRRTTAGGLARGDRAGGPATVQDARSHEPAAPAARQKPPRCGHRARHHEHRTRAGHRPKHRNRPASPRLRDRPPSQNLAWPDQVAPPAGLTARFRFRLDTVVCADAFETPAADGGCCVKPREGLWCSAWRPPAVGAEGRRSPA